MGAEMSLFKTPVVKQFLCYRWSDLGTGDRTIPVREMYTHKKIEKSKNRDICHRVPYRTHIEFEQQSNLFVSYDVSSACD